MKYQSLAGLTRGHVGGSDATVLEWYRRVLWTTAGRPGDAFVRLAWREACRLVDEPLIWRAVEAELFSGLLRQEPAAPEPGDSVQFTLRGPQAEALIEAAGIEPANLIDAHRCGPECIKGSRKTSRRWQRYLAEWAKESKDAA